MAATPRISGLLWLGLLGQFVGNLLQMEIVQVKRVAQMIRNCRVRHIEDLGK
jgi:hypothetical protein